VKPSAHVMGLAVACLGTAAQAGNPVAGRRVAQERCAICHVVAPGPRDELAMAPPFEVIANKFPPELGSLIIALRGPHRMMNFRPTQSEAEDIAAYIATLKR
jgi:mono/diheme cytochrome c family protein